MQRKKILYIITKSVWGGAGKYVFDLATTLPKSTYEAVVALGGSGILKERLERENVPVYSIEGLDRDLNIFNDFSVLSKIIEIIKIEKPDIIHLNSSKIGGIGALAGRITKVPKIIYTAHGWPHNEDRSNFQKKLIKFFSWVTVILSHQTIVLSKKEYSEVVSWPLVKDKFKIIKNGISSPMFSNREYSRKFLAGKIESPITNETIIVGSIGELTKNKGFSYAINAFKDLVKENHNIKYLIIGEGEDREELEELVRVNKLQNHCFLVGFIPDASSFITGFDITLLPSIKEGLPYVILENTYAKVPIIATSVGGIPEMIEHDVSGLLVEPKNSEMISLSIKRLVENTSLGKRLSLTLYNFINQEYHPRDMKLKTEEIYNK